MVAPGTGYTCGACPSGYSGDGTTCIDVDDCADAPCGDNGACIDTGTNTYACNCADGCARPGAAPPTPLPRTAPLSKKNELMFHT